MSQFGVRILAILLIVGGTLGLAYGRLTFTKSEQEASFGPIGLTIKEKQSIPVPAWLGIALVAGGALVLLSGKRGYRT
jgi:hypothetical protein